MEPTEQQLSQARALRALSDLGVAYQAITVHCPSCEILSHVMAPTLGLAKWIEGAMVQDAMPELTDSQRELLITGFCERCQADIFTTEG